MGHQQNPDGIYVPPGINRRFPLDLPKNLASQECDGKCATDECVCPVENED